MDTQNTILLIGQEIETALYLASMFGERSYKIAEARSANDALRIMIERSFDLIVLDLHLPDRDGLSLIPEINQLSPNIPILVYTDVVEADVVIDALRKGASDYILKPGNPGDLLLRVNELLHQSVNR